MLQALRADIAAVLLAVEMDSRNTTVRFVDRFLQRRSYGRHAEDAAAGLPMPANVITPEACAQALYDLLR